MDWKSIGVWVVLAVLFSLLMDWAYRVFRDYRAAETKQRILDKRAKLLTLMSSDKLAELFASWKKGHPSLTDEQILDNLTTLDSYGGLSGTYHGGRLV